MNKRSRVPAEERAEAAGNGTHGPGRALWPA